MGQALNRDEMIEAINKGQVVSFQGRLLRHVDDVPDSGEIAVTAEEKRVALRELEQHRNQVEARIKELTNEIDDTEKAEQKQQQDARQRQAAEAQRQAAGTTSGATGHVVPNAGKTVGSGDPAQTGANGGNGGAESEESDDEQVFANRKLSVYEKKIAGKSDDDARKTLQEMDGVGEATADHILSAVKANKKATNAKK